MRLILSALFALFFFFPLNILHAVDGVTIDKSPAKIETKHFDPKRPPAEMPALHANEAAVTASNLGCQTEMGVTVKSNDARPGHYEAKIDSVSVKLTLSITIWLPHGAVRKIIDHENGHRKISEIFYADADKIARDLAEPYLGKTLAVDGADREKAVNDALTTAINQLNDDFMGKVQTPMQRAQEAFDKITDHGRNKVGEEEAIKKAVGKK